MRLSRLLTAILLGCGCFTALACEVPPLPVFPADDSIRGRVERDLKEAMVSYITEMSVYVACVQAEHASAERTNATDLHLALLATRHNDAIDELEAVRDIYVARVGPIEELFFEQGFDGGSRGRNAPPRSMPVPTGPDSVLRRTEIILGDELCAELSPCNKDVTSGGVDRNVRPITRPSRSDPTP